MKDQSVQGAAGNFSKIFWTEQIFTEAGFATSLAHSAIRIKFIHCLPSASAKTASDSEYVRGSIGSFI